MFNYLTFGGFIYQKRHKIHRSLREISAIINISPVYLSEMENNKKTNPSHEIMQKLIDVLCLNEEDKALFYDLHAKANGIISQDLPDYIMENGIVRKALRTAKDKPATDEDWQVFIKQLE